MARLPDRFDLWVRKARESTDPARQVDYILGALTALPEWHFLNIGSPEQPAPGETEFGGEKSWLVFSDPGRVEELFAQGQLPSLISIPTPAAMKWCVEQKAGLLVNAGEDAAVIPYKHVKTFHTEWSQRAAQQPSGFWIPNMTTAEDDFWQEHGL